MSHMSLGFQSLVADNIITSVSKARKDGADILVATTFKDFKERVKPEIRLRKTSVMNTHLVGFGALLFLSGFDRDDYIPRISTWKQAEEAKVECVEYIEYLETIRRVYKNGTCVYFNDFCERASRFESGLIDKIISDEPKIIIEMNQYNDTPLVPDDIWAGLNLISDKHKVKEYICRVIIDNINKRHTLHIHVNSDSLYEVLMSISNVQHIDITRAKDQALKWYCAMWACWNMCDKYEHLGKSIRKSKKRLKSLETLAYKLNGYRETPVQYRNRNKGDEFQQEYDDTGYIYKVSDQNKFNIDDVMCKPHRSGMDKRVSPITINPIKYSNVRDFVLSNDMKNKIKNMCKVEERTDYERRDSKKKIKHSI